MKKCFFYICLRIINYLASIVPSAAMLGTIRFTRFIHTRSAFETRTLQ